MQASLRWDGLAFVPDQPFEFGHGCSPCEELMPHVATWQREFAARWDTHCGYCRGMPGDLRERERGAGERAERCS